ncbi:MAG TPA: hypothetical protein EYP18_10080 [Desulfobacterales bacterium]|nr:hypothetical protein [Desulfobacterales bacterium]
MSHTYLIDLYNLIDQRLVEVACELNSSGSGTEQDYLKGRSECLVEFRQFLATHYNSMLPRRIRGKYSA